MGSMGHDNEGFFVEHYVDDGTGATTLRKFSRSLWGRLEASAKIELPLERQHVVRINSRYMTFDREIWLEAEASWTSE